MSNQLSNEQREKVRKLKIAAEEKERALKRAADDKDRERRKLEAQQQKTLRNQQDVGLSYRPSDDDKT